METIEQIWDTFNRACPNAICRWEPIPGWWFVRFANKPARYLTMSQMKMLIAGANDAGLR